MLILQFEISCVQKHTHTQYLSTTLIASLLSMVQGHQYLAVASLKSSTSEKITRKQVLWSSWCKSPFWEASLSHKVMVKRLLIAIQEREYLPQLRKREQKVASASHMNLVTALIQLGRHHIIALPLIMLLFTQLRKDSRTSHFIFSCE